MPAFKQNIYTAHRHQTDSLLGGIWMKGKYVWVQTEKCDEKQRALAACGSIKKSSFWSAGRVSVCSYIGLLCVLELKEDAAWAAESCVCVWKSDKKFVEPPAQHNSWQESERSYCFLLNFSLLFFLVANLRLLTVYECKPVNYSRIHC